jgi:hypothetical protein
MVASRLPLGRPRVGGENDFGALFNQKLQGGKRLDDAGVIGDDHLAITFLQRHIVIHAHEHAFAANVQISNSKFCHKLELNKRGG